MRRQRSRFVRRWVFEAENNPQDTEIEPDRTGQLSMNPFIYGDPVPPEKFYGRRQAILEVKNRIGAIASQSVNIVGLRRIGKTSLLQYIRSNPTEFIKPDRQPFFKGRQDFADRLVRLILDRNRPTLVLHDPRRAGKTSFLLNLPRLLNSDVIPIYLDMQQSSMTASEGNFCYGLVRAITSGRLRQRSGYPLSRTPTASHT